MKIDLSSYQPKRKEISIPSWTPEPIYVQELLGKQLELIQNAAKVEKGRVVIKHQFALLIVCSLVDADGNYLFTEDDIKDLEKQPADIITEIMKVIKEVSDVELADE
jgi:hypothetical protein